MGVNKRILDELALQVEAHFDAARAYGQLSSEALRSGKKRKARKLLAVSDAEMGRGKAVYDAVAQARLDAANPQQIPF
jgi:hypothetical protein